MKNDPILSKTRFILLNIVSLVCAITSAIIDAYNETLIWLNEVLDKEPQMWELVALVIISIYCIIILVSLLGVLFLKEWARKIYIYSYFPTFFIFAFPPYISWQYMSGISASFANLSIALSALVWGILIVPSLYQPLFQSKA